LLGISKVQVSVISQGILTKNEDLLVREEPLEIRLGLGPKDSREQFSLSVTMRTPGDDEDLAIGFLYSESIIHSAEDFSAILYCSDIKKPEEKGNVIRVELKPEIKVDLEKLNRHFYTSSSCGVCGKSSLEAVEQVARYEIQTLKVDEKLVRSFPSILQKSQSLFKATGGIHAAGLFDAEGNLLSLKEDIGRHNAVDKLIGSCLVKNGIPLKNRILVVSGRAGFELIQKAILAGFSAFVSVGAPSTLSVELARKHNLKLYGFVKAGGFNIYS
jgi:FdhD protein